MLQNIVDDLGIVPEKIIPRVIMEKIFKKCLKASKVTALVDTSNLTDLGCASCSDKKVEEYIIKQLKRNKPVGIGYCSNVLSDKDADMIYPNSHLTILDNTRVVRSKSACAGHASIVAGSRKKDNKCQLLVRNSWGDWKSSTWKDCLCETSKGVFKDCKYGDKKINSVGCWVDSDSLTRNIMDTTHF